MSSRESRVGDLRIVLLGKSVSENSRVGNFILGRAAFDSEAPPDVVERVGGRLKDRHLIIINSPQLLQTNISDHQLTQTVRECVYLSDPGPHVFIIILQYKDFTEEDLRRVKYMLERFSEEAVKRSIVITTDEEMHDAARANELIQQPGPHVIVLLLKHEPCSTEDQECVEKVLHSFSERVYQHTVVLSSQETTETSDILQNIIQKCANRHFSLQRSSSPDDLLQTLEDIEKMNDGRYLHCAEAAQCFTMKQQNTERLSEGVKLNLVVCGSDGTLKSSVSEQILQQTDRRSDVELHSRLINLISLPALNQLSEEEVMCKTLHCVSLCDPGVHAFIIIIPVGRNTDKIKKR
ncbi:GTPase IMAP family member 4-like [Sinocyclocheilus rhinocerous]|uniref:GTPase IMAP family member 4-like n=1 Tax=Sinocyclocheilus rhinocerous TaxID=307959 RepID=UPI0007BA453B|nr:PREDICTED: GTPase IMAP family member 4-like [Sinocyclocheilus rhinocerous]